MKIIKTLELVGDDIVHPTDATTYYPGGSFQLTTETHGFPDVCVVAVSGSGLTEPLAFTMDEVKAMHKFFGDIIYGEGGEW